MVIEDMGDMAMELMCKLLRTLDASVIVTPEQMKRVSELPLHCLRMSTAFGTRSFVLGILNFAVGGVHV